MMVTEAKIEDEAARTYTDFVALLPGLMARATNEEAQQLLARAGSLRDIMWKAQAEQLRDFNATVEHLYEELKTTRVATIEKLKSIQSVAEAIGLATELVKLAGSLVIAAAI
jgi:hypothetical protein